MVSILNKYQKKPPKQPAAFFQRTQINPNQGGKHCVWYTIRHAAPGEARIRSIKPCNFNNIMRQKWKNKSKYRTLKAGSAIFRAQYLKNRAVFDYDPKTEVTSNVLTADKKYIVEKGGFWFASTQNHCKPHHDRYPFITKYIVTEDIELLWFPNLFETVKKTNGDGGDGYTLIQKGLYETMKKHGHDIDGHDIGGYAGCNECELFIDVQHLHFLSFDHTASITLDPEYAGFKPNEEIDRVQLPHEVEVEEEQKNANPPPQHVEVVDHRRGFLRNHLGKLKSAMDKGTVFGEYKKVGPREWVRVDGDKMTKDDLGKINEQLVEYAMNHWDEMAVKLGHHGMKAKNDDFGDMYFDEVNSLSYDDGVSGYNGYNAYNGDYEHIVSENAVYSGYNEDIKYYGAKQINDGYYNHALSYYDHYGNNNEVYLGLSLVMNLILFIGVIVLCCGMSVLIYCHVTVKSKNKKKIYREIPVDDGMIEI